MKATKNFWIACLATLVFTSSSMALSFDFYDEARVNQEVEALPHYMDPDFYAELAFPDGGTSANYPSGVEFEYDDVMEYITTFEITLEGENYNTGNSVDIFLNFDGSWISVASYNQVPYGASFSLTLDLVEESLKYKEYNWQGDVIDTDELAIQNVDMDSFIGVDSFLIAYGCYFEHLNSSVFIEGNCPPVVPVPEPLSIILLLAGLVKLVHWSRK